MPRIARYLLLIVASLCVSQTLGGLTDLYKSREPIVVYSNKIGPYENPDETYEYHAQEHANLFCQAEVPDIKSQNLGENLEGDSKAVSAFKLHFASPVKKRSACRLALSADDLIRLKDYIARDFYYEFVIDDIPVHGFVGKQVRSLENYGFSGTDEKYYYYNHLKFTLLYNWDEGSIIFANVTHDEKDAILLQDKGQKIEVFYSVTWVAVPTLREDRTKVYAEHFFDASAHGEGAAQIHWFAVINAAVLVLLLTGFVGVILLRILRADIARYSRIDEGADEREEYGWKMVAHDVFRPPSQPMLLSAAVGTGLQFLVMASLIIFLALTGLFQPSQGNDGAAYVAALLIYAFTCAIGGYAANYYYKQLDGSAWVWLTLLTATIFALPFLSMALFVNTVAAIYQVTKALPPSAVFTVLLIWLFVGIPLTLLGSVAGKRSASSFTPPVRPKHFARQIPPIPWYRNRFVQLFLAGFLPFSAIYVELHYLFDSLWGRTFYQLWGILGLVFGLLLVVTATTTVALTYFQLSLEDYRWWHISFLWGGSTGFYIFAYAFYFWFFRSRMTGFLQATFFFGYQLFICYFFFLMLGAIGFLSAFAFVRRIYAAHMD